MASAIAQAAVVYYGTGHIFLERDDFAQRGAQIGPEPRCIAKLPDRERWLLHWSDSEGNLTAFTDERSRKR